MRPGDGNGGPIVDWSRPTEENRRELAAVVARLRAAGVPAGPGGYDEPTLARAIEGRGWRWAVAPTRPGAAAPYHATVEGGGEAPPRHAVYAFGWTGAVALARALDRMLREAGGGSRPA